MAKSSLLDLSVTAQVPWPLCLASLGLGGIRFTLKVWQALLDLSVTAQVPWPLCLPWPLRYRDRFAAFGGLGGPKKFENNLLWCACVCFLWIWYRYPSFERSCHLLQKRMKIYVSLERSENNWPLKHLKNSHWNRSVYVWSKKKIGQTKFFV